MHKYFFCRCCENLHYIRMETWTTVWPWNEPDERLQVTSVRWWWPGRVITQYFNATPNLKLNHTTFQSPLLRVLPCGITVGNAVAKIVLAAWLPLTDSNLTYVAFLPNLAGLHRVLNTGQLAINRLLTPFPLRWERKPICGLYLKCHVVCHWRHVSRHEWAGNSCNRRE